MRPDGLRVIFDNVEFMLISHSANRLHVGALAIEVHGNDGLGFRRDGRLDFVWVNALGLRVAIHEYDGGACDPDGFGGGEEGIGMGNDLVTLADSEGHQRQPNSVGAVTHPDGELRAMIGRQFAFKAFEHRSHDVLAAFQHGLEVMIDLGLDIAVLSNVTVKFNFHGAKRYPKDAGRQGFSPATELRIE